MAKSFTIPAIFTAVDKISAPVQKMQNSMSVFAAKAEGGIARSERMFRKMTPALGEASKQFLSFASTAAIAGGIVGGVSFSVDAIKDYEDALASLKVITGDVNGSFKGFQEQSILVAKETKSSSIDVVKAFESIAGLNADLAATPKILGEVTKSAILLSKGSGDELQKSAENLVGILNQFNYTGEQSQRVIDTLAAGQAYGASSISKTADAFTVFGAVAKSANIEVEQATALVQVLGSKMILGSEAGTALRGSIGLLQKSGFGYKKGLFDINDALEEAKAKYDKLRTAKEKDAFIAKTFGEVNKSTGMILLDNIKQLGDFTEKVSRAGEAQKAADTKTDTLTAKLDELKAAWVSMITGSDGASSALDTVKGAMGFVIENLDTIVSIGFNVLKFFLLWKTAILVSKAAMVGYNVVLGIHSAVTGASSLAMQGNVVALGAQKVALAVSTAAQWGLNAAMSANPVAAVVLAIMALVAALGYLIANYKSVEDLHNESKNKNRTAAIQEEAKAVQFLADKYEKAGRSQSEARAKAIDTSKRMVLQDIEGVKVQLASAKTEEDRRIAEKQLATLQGRAQALLTPEQLFEKKQIVSPTTDAQQVMAQNSTNTNNAEVLIKVDAPAGTEAKSDNKSVSVVPVVGSTMPKR